MELGVKEAHEALVVNGLRGRIKLRTDGGFHTGRDVVVAAMLGAEAYGFGTTALVALGCKMARQCHLNTCPVGVATQREDLRAKYFGKPQMLIDFLLHVAEEVRVILAGLGYRSLDEIIGRSDLLQQIPPDRASARVWSTSHGCWPRLRPIPEFPRMRVQERNDRRHDIPLDDELLPILEPHIDREEHISAKFDITNEHRRSGLACRAELRSNTATSACSAGRSSSTSTARPDNRSAPSGPWDAPLPLRGEANDYVGKGIAGGMIPSLRETMLASRAAMAFWSATPSCMGRPVARSGSQAGPVSALPCEFGSAGSGRGRRRSRL